MVTASQVTSVNNDIREAYTAVIASPCGMLGIIENGDVVQAIHFLYDTAASEAPHSELAKKVVMQLNQYFVHSEFQFNLPLLASATPFQARVRLALQRIPLGKSLSYAKLAKTMTSSARAIAGACRRNPVPIIVPCHRIVAVNGIGGFSGAVDGKPLENKKWLLKHESAIP